MRALKVAVIRLYTLLVLRRQLLLEHYKNIFRNQSKKITILTSYPGINGAPAWSPDGSKLALVLSKDGSPKIYILNLVNDTLQKIPRT